MPERVSYAQNGEDVRIWHAFGPREPQENCALTYVEVGANEPRRLSLTAALFDLGWRGLLVEADPELASELKRERPGDVVVEAAAAATDSELTFYRVPGTGLGTLDTSEAEAARAQGFTVTQTSVTARPLDEILDDFVESSGRRDIHVLSVDVEGAEGQVLAGLSLRRHRPWVLCIEAVTPGTHEPSHDDWENHVLDRGYQQVAFDGVNRWYVADEWANTKVAESAGSRSEYSIAEAIATPFHVLDAGAFGWQTNEIAELRRRDNRHYNRSAWQREILRHDGHTAVPTYEYERQIHELRSTLITVEGSRTFRMSRRLAKVGKRGVHVVQKARSALPGPLSRRLVKERHLRHVTVNMGHLTPAAFLGGSGMVESSWLTPAGELADGSPNRPPIPPGTDLGTFIDQEEKQAREWLTNFVFDGDLQLDARMDNHNDEVGRVRAALRSRIALKQEKSLQSESNGHRVAFDARALQSAAFGERGIGRFAKAALLALRARVGDERITLLVDRGLHPLPEELAGACAQVSRMHGSDVSQFHLFVQPSPMTHSPDPYLPILLSDINKVAVVFDFIPLHFPAVYLADVASRAEYSASIDALKLYSSYVCISQTVKTELIELLDAPATAVSVAWPRDIQIAGLAKEPRDDRTNPGPIVLMTGDDARKNTFGGLAGIAAATTDEATRNVVVVGMANQDDRVHHWSIAAAMRPGEARTAGHLTDVELRELLASAECVVVPSFDEGLSLPVLEAASAGVPVVASDILAHRELLGSGAHLFDPKNPRSIARAIRRTRSNQRIASRQRSRLARLDYLDLEGAMTNLVSDQTVDLPVPSPAYPPHQQSSPRLRVGVATPWPPQRTGVGDYSRAVLTELATMVDLTVYTTSDARVDSAQGLSSSIEQRSVEELFDHPSDVQNHHDVLVSVVGNSHYHLPFVQVLDRVDAVAIAHDTRMSEFYMALRGRGGLRELMLTTADEAAPRTLVPTMDDQIDDMRLLQNAGLWEVAQRSTSLVLHSPSSAFRIERETNVPVTVLPFAHYRDAPAGTITVQDRREARTRLGFDRFPPETKHLATFGYVDIRTKMVDVVVEATAWLRQWGQPVVVHLVGHAGPEEESKLRALAADAGIDDLHITGFQTEEQYRDWLLAIDAGIQLRVSPYLGVSGPLSDLSAYGTPAVASAGLCADVDPPTFVRRLPDSVSPVIVAEEVEKLLRSPMPPTEREVARLAYLESKSPAAYAQLLLNHLRAVVA